jgi:hypothetical protein
MNLFLMQARRLLLKSGKAKATPTKPHPHRGVLTIKKILCMQAWHTLVKHLFGKENLRMMRN